MMNPLQADLSLLRVYIKRPKPQPKQFSKIDGIFQHDFGGDVEDVNDESISGSSAVTEGVAGVDVFCEDVSHLWFWQCVHYSDTNHTTFPSNKHRKFQQ